MPDWSPDNQGQLCQGLGELHWWGVAQGPYPGTAGTALQTDVSLADAFARFLRLPPNPVSRRGTTRLRVPVSGTPKPGRRFVSLAGARERQRVCALTRTPCLLSGAGSQAPGSAQCGEVSGRGCLGPACPGETWDTPTLRTAWDSSEPCRHGAPASPASGPTFPVTRPACASEALAAKPQLAAWRRVYSAWRPLPGSEPCSSLLNCSLHFQFCH